MSKFTPGPWAFGSYHKLLVVPVINGSPDKYQQIADLGDTAYPFNDTPYDEERYANASLISAAPDLLEALRGLMYKDCGEPAFVTARAAIEKATKETP